MKQQQGNETLVHQDIGLDCGAFFLRWQGDETAEQLYILTHVCFFVQETAAASSLWLLRGFGLLLGPEVEER